MSLSRTVAAGVATAIGSMIVTQRSLYGVSFTILYFPATSRLTESSGKEEPRPGITQPATFACGFALLYVLTMVLNVYGYHLILGAFAVALMVSIGVVDAKKQTTGLSPKWEMEDGHGFSPSLQHSMYHPVPSLSFTAPPSDSFVPFCSLTQVSIVSPLDCFHSS